MKTRFWSVLGVLLISGSGCAIEANNPTSDETGNVGPQDSGGVDDGAATTNVDDDAGDDSAEGTTGTQVMGCDGDGDAAQPFGAHEHTYTTGVIMPNHVTGQQLDDAVRLTYDEWKSRHLSSGCAAGHYHVRTNDADSHTVSEAHGYGMLISAYMAGWDPDARSIFDGLYQYYAAHPSEIDPTLMAWSQNSSCVTDMGAASASDGDLDIAFALLLADKQWGSGGEVDYASAAGWLLSSIVESEVDESHSWVRLGDWTSMGSPETYYATRSSDFMPSHFSSFEDVAADGTWGQVRDRTYTTMASVQSGYASATGLFPDFIVQPDNPYPPSGLFLEDSTRDGQYAFNACRDPWRIGLDYLINGDSRAKALVEPINAWIQSKTGGDAWSIGAGYWLDGDDLPGTGYYSLAFSGPLGVAAMVDAQNQGWLNAVWDSVVQEEGGTYYGDSIRVLTMIAMSGNWWAPEDAPCPT